MNAVLPFYKISALQHLKSAFAEAARLAPFMKRKPTSLNDAAAVLEDARFAAARSSVKVAVPNPPPAAIVKPSPSLPQAVVATPPQAAIQRPSLPKASVPTPPAAPTVPQSVTIAARLATETDPRERYRLAEALSNATVSEACFTGVGVAELQARLDTSTDAAERYRLAAAINRQ
jgi:hypothetical protein